MQTLDKYIKNNNLQNVPIDTAKEQLRTEQSLMEWAKGSFAKKMLVNSYIQISRDVYLNPSKDEKIRQENLQQLAVHTRMIDMEEEDDTFDIEDYIKGSTAARAIKNDETPVLSLTKNPDNFLVKIKESGLTKIPGILDMPEDRMVKISEFLGMEQPYILTDDIDKRKSRERLKPSYGYDAKKSHEINQMIFP